MYFLFKLQITSELKQNTCEPCNASTTLCVVCLECRSYVCCSECNIVSNKGNEPTPCLTQPIGGHGGEVMYFACFALWVNLVSLIVITSACVL